MVVKKIFQKEIVQQFGRFDAQVVMALRHRKINSHELETSNDGCVNLSVTECKFL